MEDLNLIVSDPDTRLAGLLERGFSDLKDAGNALPEKAEYPKTVSEVADYTQRGDDFWLALGDFLDFVKSRRGTAVAKAIKDEPIAYPKLSAWQYAYLAAVADSISWSKGVYANRADIWFRGQKYCLDTPWFPPNTEGDLRIILWLESPPEFRKRGLFVSENALVRV